MPIILEEKRTGGQEKSNLHLSILLSTNVSSVPKQNQELKNCLLYNLNSKIMLNTQHNPDTQITKFISQLTQQISQAWPTSITNNNLTNKQSWHHRRALIKPIHASWWQHIPKKYTRNQLVVFFSTILPNQTIRHIAVNFQNRYNQLKKTSTKAKRYSKSPTHKNGIKSTKHKQQP